eukprot:CAMPEP_0197243118 /NCGR_PEP_ID=MMETSP1429-20130617/8662_1 /TAXON_ID=49237 /ORGANISM="Chaetoceros  sp., Strain UNC1202" /LENGTH=466 /DNA_ID=CAMNT_0042703271 /DNA_START=13 /DNA_END=1413 /DNA_ORIENTATION=+
MTSGKILSGRYGDLVEDVLSSMSTVICDYTDFVLLNTEDSQFYDYCGTKKEVDIPELTYANVDGRMRLLAEGDGTAAPFDGKVVVVSDFKDIATGFLNIQDRSVFVTGAAGSEGNYLRWTVWTVEYPIMQFDNPIAGDGLAEEEKDELIDNALKKLQRKVDEAFSTAISNKKLDTLLMDKNDSIIASSSTGWEVETFTEAIAEHQEKNNDDETNGGDPNGVENPIDGTTKKKPGFWEPIRIIGMALLVCLVLTVTLLTRVGNKRRKVQTWEAAQKKKAAIDVNLVSYEGVDFMLETGRKMRPANGAGPLPPREEAPRDTDEDPLMDIGYSPSEIAGTKQSYAKRHTTSPTQKLKSVLTDRFGYQKEQLDNADIVQGGDEYAMIAYNTKGSQALVSPAPVPPSEGYVEHPRSPSQSKTPQSKRMLRKKSKLSRSPQHPDAEKIKTGDESEDYTFISVNPKDVSNNTW